MRFHRKHIHARPRWRHLALIVAAVALVVPASASAASFTAVLKAPNHSPTANKPWRITVTAMRGKTKLKGSVSYQFLSHGKVVGHERGRSFKHGVFHETLKFPRRAVGRALTLRVIVKTKYGTVKVPWAFKAVS